MLAMSTISALGPDGDDGLLGVENYRVEAKD